MKEIIESAPSGTAAIEWTDSLGADHAEWASPALLDRKLFRARISRTGNRYPKQRNYHGLTWFAPTATHLWHESLFERYALLSLNFRHDIIALAVQPMRMAFSEGGEHFPDFIALHADYRQVVYDVKPASRLGVKARRRFALTAAVCKKVGWGFEVFSDSDPQVRTNVEWVANFRSPRFDPPPGVRELLMSALDAPMTMRDAAATMTHEHWDATLGGIGALYHLVWTGDLTLDLTQPLSKNTLIRKATPHAHS